MSNFTEKMIDDYANKLLIGLSSEERKMIQEEFDDIEKSMELINNIDGIKDVEPLSYPFEMELTDLRSDDEVDEEIPIDILLRNAGKTDGREVEVPKVVG